MIRQQHKKDKPMIQKWQTNNSTKMKQWREDDKTMVQPWSNNDKKGCESISKWRRRGVLTVVVTVVEGLICGRNDACAKEQSITHFGCVETIKELDRAMEVVMLEWASTCICSKQARCSRQGGVRGRIGTVDGGGCCIVSWLVLLQNRSRWGGKVKVDSDHRRAGKETWQWSTCGGGGTGKEERERKDGTVDRMGHMGNIYVCYHDGVHIFGRSCLYYTSK
jgi:hypothetical protein